MGAEANKLQHLVVRLAVNQHQVGLDVAIAMLFPLARQRVIAIALGQRRIGTQQSQHLWQERFNIPVEILNPFRQIDIAGASVSGEWLTDNAPSLTVAVGLAIRHVGDETA